MADIRCPMCGKFASDELDICPVCQARLKPLIVSSSENDNSILPGVEPVKKDITELEMPNLSRSPLNKEEPIAPGEAPAEENTSGTGSVVPAWLRKLRENFGDNPPAADPEKSEQHRDLTGEEIRQSADTSEELGTAKELYQADSIDPDATDWLSGLERTAHVEDDTPAWLSSLKEIPQTELPSADPINETAPGAEDNNWLDDLRGTGSPDQEFEPQPEQTDTPNEESLVDEGVPDWMKKLQSEVDSRAADSHLMDDQDKSGIDDSPDWLNRLQAETLSSTTSKESRDQKQDNENPDWLEKMSSEVPAASDDVTQGGSETPEWLRNLQAETRAFAADVPSAEAESPAAIEEDQPSDARSSDWLNEFPPASQDSAVEKPEVGIPGWLNEFGASGSKSVEDEALPASEIPDWLKDAQPEPRVFTEGDVISENSTTGGAETPQWLNEIGTEIPANSVQEDSLVTSESPDWLKAMASELQDSSENNDPVAEKIEPDVQSKSAYSGSDDLDKMVTSQNEKNVATEQNSDKELLQPEASGQLHAGVEDQLADSGLTTDWLKNVNETDTISNDSLTQIHDEQLNGGDSVGLGSVETPEWLKTLGADDPGSQLQIEDPGIVPVVDSIKPAELPSWVQAMRPVESMVADVGVSDKQLEQVTEIDGPLAGLQGVLPATPGLGKLRKPLSYSIKLRVTDDQIAQANQLEQLLDLESQAKSSTSTVKKLPLRVLRWLVTVLVFLVVALPVFRGTRNFPSPSVYPPELVAARERLYGLPPESPILLVFDYEPAYSGELEVAAAPMVDNLLFSGARLAILSTSPTGPTLAEHFLKTTQSQHNYLSGLQYANLGYLAGGASGVLSFALDPSQTIPQAVDGSLPWQTPLLQDIHTLADFSAVIILTDNSDTARIWVEQAGSLLGETPLLMVISAQAEPMIRPYYDSGQIKGLVTGLAGGKAYEQALQMSGLGQKFWDSFSSGFFIAELIIIVGALWSIISIWRGRKPGIEGEV